METYGEAKACFDLSPLLRAAAAELGRFVSGDVAWLQAGSDDLARLTAVDRELLHVVTGEDPRALSEDDETPLSFFAWQLLADRACGGLVGEPSITYVEGVYTAYEMCVDGNPMSGDLFDLALAYLVGRDLRIDPGIISV